MTTELRFVRTTARGRVLGESNGRCRFSDAVVAQARQMRADGLHYRVIAAAVGAGLGTVHGWLNGTRAPAARVIVKRAIATRGPHEQRIINPACSRDEFEALPGDVGKSEGKEAQR